MRITLPLARHNLYRMMRNQWKVARKRRIIETPAFKVLEENNLEVIDVHDFIEPVVPKRTFDFSSIVGAKQPIDESHPSYKERPCYVYKDSSVLLEGLNQALVLTNTIELQPETLPTQIENLMDSIQLPNQDELVKRCIKTSCLYDAEQKKLPVIKDPERPAWNFPRNYGITETRKNRMLCNRLLQLCALASPSVSASRAVLSDVLLSVPLMWGDDNVKLQLRSDIFILCDKSLPPVINPAQAENQPLPDLSVIHPLISLEEDNFYELEDVFPLKEDGRFNKVHTTIVHYNQTEVSNIFDSPVTMSQTIARSLLKAYTAAVAGARHVYGPTVKDLPEPVVVQCVQTDGKTFHFSMMQLNSADVSSSRRNVFWSLPPLDLYEDCSYVGGVPTLSGYNPLVFKHLLAFYVNNP